MAYGRGKKRSASTDAEDDVASKKSKFTPSTALKDDDAGNSYWEISGKRRLQISEFKGVTMVNIREFYEKDGKTLPGKAGINLPIEQFNTLMRILPQLLDNLEEKGIEVERPNFDKAIGIDTEGKAMEPKTKKVVESKKANFEATSDEDEDD